MSRGVVLVYFSRLGGRLRRDQKVMLDVDARAIAKLKGYDFGGHHETARDYSVPVFFVPDDTLLQDEALSLGIRCVQDLYGGVVPYPFVKTKAITTNSSTVMCSSHTVGRAASPKKFARGPCRVIPHSALTTRELRRHAC